MLFRRKGNRALEIYPGLHQNNWLTKEFSFEVSQLEPFASSRKPRNG